MVTGHHNHTANSIKGDICDPEDVLVDSLFLDSPQDGAHACCKLAHTEGLGDVIIRPQFQPQHLVILIQLGGQDDNGRIPFAAVGAA